MLTSSPRRAVNPGNTVLNYAYRLLEVETTVACLAHGLDVTLDVGPLHADRDGRSSLACTVMEAARPAVDAAVLDFLEQRALSVTDFLEMPDGHVRIQLGLARQLAELMPAFRAAVTPRVEALVERLLADPDHATLSDLVARVAPNRGGRRSGPQAIEPRPGVARADTAAPLSLRQRRCGLCDALTDAAWCSQACARAAATLDQLARELDDPSKRTPEAWSLLFAAIQRVPGSRLRAATGVSGATVSLWKSGGRQPRPERWATIAAAAIRAVIR